MRSTLMRHDSLNPSVIFAVLSVFSLAPLSAWSQDIPEAEMRAAMEQRIQEQNNAAPPPEPPRGLAPNMGVVPGNNFTKPDPQPTLPGPIPQSPSQGGAEQFRGGRGRPAPQETFRNPDLNYRDRRPRDHDDDHDHRPRYRPPPVIVRPYYPPPVYIEPPRVYVPPPVYAQPYIPPQPWSGPVPRAVIWDQFPSSLFDELPQGVRITHERAFIDALSSAVGFTQSWRVGQLRGEITVIDDGYYGSSFCRDVVQTIRAPWFTRTADGRVCLKQGKAWRLVSY